MTTDLSKKQEAMETNFESADLTTSEFKKMEKFNLDMFNTLHSELLKFPEGYEELAPIDKGIAETLEIFNGLKGAFVSHNCYGHIAGEARYNGIDADEYEENSAPYLMVTMAEKVSGVSEKLEMIIEDVTSYPNISVKPFKAGMDGRYVNSYSFEYDSEVFANLTPEDAMKAQEEFVSIVTASFTKHLDRKKVSKAKQSSSKVKGK